MTKRPHPGMLRRRFRAISSRRPRASVGMCVVSALLAALPSQERAVLLDRDHGLRKDVLLSLTTTDHDFVWSIVDLLPVQLDADAMDVDEGEPMSLLFGRDHKLTVQAAAPSPLVLEMHLRPSPLKDALKSEAGLVGGLVRAATFTQLVHGFRAEPRYVARAMKAVADFPHQLEHVHITVAQRKDAPGGLKIDAFLEPRKGTWFHRVTRGVEASGRGAHLMRTPRSAMSLAAAVEGPAKDEMIAPFAEMLASLRGRTKAERAKFRALVKDRVPQFDGSFSLLIDGPGRYVRLVGLSDPTRFTDSAFTQTGLDFDQRRMGRPNIQLVDTVPEPLIDSGMKLMKKEQDIFEAVTEAAETELATFSGVVRDFSVKVRWPDDGAEVARLVERIRKRRLRRLELLDGALMVAELNFGDKRLRKLPRSELLDNELLQQFGARRLSEILEGFPENLQVGLYKRGAKGAERIHVQVLTR